MTRAVRREHLPGLFHSLVDGLAGARVAESPGGRREDGDVVLVDVDQVQRHMLVAAIRGQEAAGVPGSDGVLAPPVVYL